MRFNRQIELPIQTSGSQTIRKKAKELNNDNCIPEPQKQNFPFNPVF